MSLRPPNFLLNTPAFLQRIVADKRCEVARRRQNESLITVQQRASAVPPPRDFVAALQSPNSRLPVIAEIKKKSPSKGLLRADFDPATLASQYEAGGATCLSVLTDTPYFGGKDAHLQQARAACMLPILRKDFMLEEWQIYESRALEADAVLLIVAALTPELMHSMAQAAHKLGMAVLTESHTAEELEMALTVPNALIGINNRNLHTFEVSLQTSINLLPLAHATTPRPLTVAESGIASNADIKSLTAAGVDAFLIGETFMRASDPGTALRQLFAD
ncbi:indole-3-glycerol phosphate synthase TrpC [Candidatus Persebacteraceae bacterium Df01]|uniref:Indole-3-glycerol phosphate synthase n=1 Tax=Candidatus Doriopsillibacter californiensis TaxID=2970740 RepID=A0ABT7QLL1_9GAMM|nr:indole-3-glycerol phosphate synthase TrpC [Candidatus Persebacteraceae bacterium Df01]